MCEASQCLDIEMCWFKNVWLLFWPFTIITRKSFYKQCILEYDKEKEIISALMHPPHTHHHHHKKLLAYVWRNLLSISFTVYCSVKFYYFCSHCQDVPQLFQFIHYYVEWAFFPSARIWYIVNSSSRRH